MNRAGRSSQAEDTRTRATRAAPRCAGRAICLGALDCVVGGLVMATYLADLHVHSALSPCAADEMTPPAIVQTAREQGLSLLALCDHNAAGNTAACIEAARRLTGSGVPLTVVAGIEITTAEEVHIVGLFDGPERAAAVADELARGLPPADPSYYARFGPQHVLDADGALLGIEPHMLALATALELNDAVSLVHRHGGLAIAAHVNRRSFSVIAQLGVFPVDAGFDAIEVFVAAGAGPGTALSPAAAVAEFTRYGLPVIASSDAHFLGDVGRARTRCEMEGPSFAELRMALRGEGGRRVAVEVG